jgi:hypothetical protein
LWNSVPYLFFTGPKGSGKTKAQETIASIGFRSFMTSNIRVAGLYRAIEKYGCSVHIDEFDTMNKKDKEEVYGILNYWKRGL